MGIVLQNRGAIAIFELKMKGSGTDAIAGWVRDIQQLRAHAVATGDRHWLFY